MTDPGDASPEAAAMTGYSEAAHCRVVASRRFGDDAYVLLNTGSSGQPYLYGVNCGCENGRWFEQGSRNCPGWEQTGHDPDVGTLSEWGEAPQGAEAVRVVFEGNQVEQPVNEGAYLVCWWRVPFPSDWPRVVGFKINGAWTGAPGARHALSQPTMASFEKNIEIAPSSETEARQREVRLLISIAEPEPEYRPFILTDEASLLDALGTEPEEISRRLNAYFGADLALDIALPIWRLVDQIKRLRPRWPEDVGPN